MGIVKILIALVAIHLGLGFSQMMMTYWLSDVVHHGSQGVISYTPLGPLLNSFDSVDVGFAPSAIGNGISFINNLGDTVNGLASFDYDMLSRITAQDGFVYNVVVGFKLMGVLFAVSIFLRLLYMLFESGILSTRPGQLLLAAALLVPASSAVGWFV